MPTLKAIHICNSHQPMLQPKIAKEYVFANADRQPKKNTERTTHGILHAGFIGIRAFAAREISRCKLKGNRFVIPHDTIPPTVRCKCKKNKNEKFSANRRQNVCDKKRRIKSL